MPAPGAPGAGTGGGPGAITYKEKASGQVFTLRTDPDAVPNNISLLLSRLFDEDIASKEEWLNISPGGHCLLTSTYRAFNPSCEGWACLVFWRFGPDVIRVNPDTVPQPWRADFFTDGLIHPEGFSAVACDEQRAVVVFPHRAGPHEANLWAVSRPLTAQVDYWDGPVLLTDQTNYETNRWPALSADGRSVVYNCIRPENGSERKAICEAPTDGSSRPEEILAPDWSNGPYDLHHPDYAAGGDIIFEGAGGGMNEAIWVLKAGGGAPEPVGDFSNSDFNNDNSPCYLTGAGVSQPIVSLWLRKVDETDPNADTIHQIKTMSSDGVSRTVVFNGADVADVGIGCD